MTRHSDEVLSEDLRRLHVWMTEQEQVGNIYQHTRRLLFAYTFRMCLQPAEHI